MILAFRHNQNLALFGFCLQLIFETLHTQMQTILIALKTKEAQDASRNESIGVGSWAFYQLILEQILFQSVVVLVKTRPTWGAEINPFIFFRFFTIEYAHYTESMGQEVGDKTNARDVIQLRFAF